MNPLSVVCKKEEAKNQKYRNANNHLKSHRNVLLIWQQVPKALWVMLERKFEYSWRLTKLQTFGMRS